MPSKLLVRGLWHVVLVLGHLIHSCEPLGDVLRKLSTFSFIIEHLIIINPVDDLPLVSHLHQKHLVSVGLLWKDINLFKYVLYDVVEYWSGNLRRFSGIASLCSRSPWKLSFPWVMTFNTETGSLTLF